MKKFIILLIGSTISIDHKLITSLDKFSRVFTNVDGIQIEKKNHNFKIDLIIFEISCMSDIKVIKKLRDKHVQVPILVVDGVGDIETIINAFSIGVKDVFIKPYKQDLLAERANALLRHLIK